MKNIIDICNVNIPNSLHSLYEASILADVEDTLNDKTIFKKANDQIDWIYDMLNGWSTDNWETNNSRNQIDRSWATTKFGERSYAARKWKGLKELCKATTGENYLWMDITIRRRINKRTLNIEAYDIKISWYNDSKDAERYISIMSIPESKFKSWDDLAQNYVVPIFKSIDSMIDHFEKYKPEIQEY